MQPVLDRIEKSCGVRFWDISGKTRKNRLCNHDDAFH